MGKLTRHWDDPKSEAYRYRAGSGPPLAEARRAWVVEAARRVLHDYGILGAGDVFRPGPGAGDSATTCAGSDGPSRGPRTLDHGAGLPLLPGPGRARRLAR